MKQKLIEAVIKNKNNISYINLDDQNKYLGWTYNFNIKLPTNEYMKLDLHDERDLFLLFVLASSWSKTGQWENAAFFTTYLKYFKKDKLNVWIDDNFIEQEIKLRKENSQQITKICTGINPRKKVSFRRDYFSSVQILIEKWQEIKTSLKQAEIKNDYNTFIEFISTIEGLGTGKNKMRIKIPLILRELRCQNTFQNIPGEFCCVPDERVKESAKKLGINLPSINSISSLLKASEVIYKHFGDLYDIPLFSYEDVMYEINKYQTVF